MDVMRHEEDRRGPAPQPLVQLFAGHLVEGRKGLVHEEHLRGVGEGARDVDPLDDPARELVRALLLVAREAELDEQVAGREPSAASDPLGEGHVVDRALPRQPRRALRHQPHHPGSSGHRRRLAPDPHLAGRRLLEVGDDAQEGRLPAA